MIQQATLSVESQWQKELKQSFTRLKPLFEYLSLPTDQIVEDQQASQLFNMRVPKHFASLMEPANANDPLLLQVMPSRLEFNQFAGFTTDPLNEQSSELPGLLHKYKSRVLLMLKTGCAVNCRYCFRRHFPYQDNSVNKQKLVTVFGYLKQHTEVNEVILSGGDPLMADDDMIVWLFEQLASIPSIKRIRIHTRLPVVIPSRLTKALFDAMANTKVKVILVMHINHANEISELLTQKLNLFKHANITLLNQAVLLKDINDSIVTQVALSEKLFDAGILPYYLHLLDRVEGASHFEVNDNDAKELYQKMLTELPGFLVPKLVREVGGETSKTPVLPNA